MNEDIVERITAKVLAAANRGEQLSEMELSPEEWKEALDEMARATGLPYAACHLTEPGIGIDLETVVGPVHLTLKG